MHIRLTRRLLGLAIFAWLVGVASPAAYTSRAFTDQITGFAGSMRRSMGRRVMANQIQTIFEAGRKKVQ